VAVLARERRKIMKAHESMRAGRRIAVLLVALLGTGALIASPASAGKFLTKKKAMKLFYSKSVADARFVNVGERAGDADMLDRKDSTAYLDATATAADADLLDGQDSSVFQEGCENGAVQAWAQVREPVSAEYSVVATSFSCAGVQIRVRQASTGIYRVDFGGGELAPPCQPRVAVVSPVGDIVEPVFAGTDTVNDSSGGLLPNCVVGVDVFSDDGLHVEYEDFTVVLLSPVPTSVLG
jgi:hypothetical protein